MKKPNWFWYQAGGISLALIPSFYCIWALSFFRVDVDSDGAEFPYFYFALVCTTIGYIIARVGEKQEEEARIRRIVMEITKGNSDVVGS